MSAFICRRKLSKVFVRTNRIYTTFVMEAVATSDIYLNLFHGLSSRLKITPSIRKIFLQMFLYPDTGVLKFSDFNSSFANVVQCQWSDGQHLDLEPADLVHKSEDSPTSVSS